MRTVKSYQKRYVLVIYNVIAVNIVRNVKSYQKRYVLVIYNVIAVNIVNLNE